jgi:ABC-2 type transport system ATP-binding protein
MRSGSLVAEDSIDGLRAATEGGATLTVTVDRATDAVTSAVRGLDGVEAVTVDGDRLWVAAEAGAKVAVIDAVRDAGAAIEDFETSEASLEDLFVSYTEEGAA